MLSVVVLVVLCLTTNSHAHGFFNLVRHEANDTDCSGEPLVHTSSIDAFICYHIGDGKYAHLDCDREHGGMTVSHCIDSACTSCIEYSKTPEALCIPNERLGYRESAYCGATQQVVPTLINLEGFLSADCAEDTRSVIAGYRPDSCIHNQEQNTWSKYTLIGSGMVETDYDEPTCTSRPIGTYAFDGRSSSCSPLNTGNDAKRYNGKMYVKPHGDIGYGVAAKKRSDSRQNRW